MRGRKPPWTTCSARRASATSRRSRFWRYRGGPARHQGVAALAGRATGATCARSASGSRQHCKAPLTLTSERKETSALVVLVPGAESGQFPGVLFLQPEPEEPFDAGRNEGCPSNRSREVGRANCLARTVVGLAVYRPSQVQPLSR